MSSLVRSAARNPDFLLGLEQRVSLFSARRIEEANSWLRRFFVYRGEIEEVIRTPEFMLNDLEKIGRLEGDCDDISTFSAAVFASLGYPVRLVAIRYTPGQLAFEHVFTEIFDSGEWRVIDPTLPDGTVMHVLAQMVEVV